MWRSVAAILTDLQECARRLDLALDNGDRVSFMLHAHQRETALVHLTEMVDRELSKPASCLRFSGSRPALM